MQFWKVVATVCAISLANPSNAALINNGLFTTDTESGLDWLDLTSTVNLSYDYIASEMGEGGVFDGWALASRDQLTELLNHAGGSGTYDGWSTANNGVVSPLLDMWGDASTDPQNNYFYVLFDEVDPVYPRHALAYIFDTTKSTQGLTSDLINLDHGLWTDSSSSTQVGAALVRVSAVPVPAAVWLFVSGICCLLGFYRRSNI